jgi:hypothetical protein
LFIKYPPNKFELVIIHVANVVKNADKEVFNINNIEIFFICRRSFLIITKIRRYIDILTNIKHQFTIPIILPSLDI